MVSNGTPIKPPGNHREALGTGMVPGGLPTGADWDHSKSYCSGSCSNIAVRAPLWWQSAAMKQRCDTGVGIRVKSYKASVYIISGICAAVAGILTASRTAMGSPVVGKALSLTQSQRVLLAGRACPAAEGSAVKTLVGVLILALIGNIMNLLAVPSYPQDVIKGLYNHCIRAATGRNVKQEKPGV